MDETRQIVERTVLEEWGRVVAILFRQLGDLELAEDAAQDAFEQAFAKWPRDGAPDNPAAWLVRVAQRKAIDHIRRQTNFRTKQAHVALLAELERDTATPGVPEEPETNPIPDERLSLIFTCCHPALSHEAQVALTLKTIGGMSVAEIARAFLTTEPTMAQRLVRAKRKIKAAGMPYDVPGPDQWQPRLSSVLSVIYFIFNEGYAASSGPDAMRKSLCAEAIHLGRVLAHLLPTEAEVLGLVGLMLLHDARRDARSDKHGNIIPLEFQNRRLWHGGKINDGSRYLKTALDLNNIGAFQLQAIISACHDQAPRFAETNWDRIVAAYDQLYALNPSPVLLLNRAVAISFSKDAAAGLEALASLEVEPRLAAYQPYHAARADMLRRLGHKDQARMAYDRAITLSKNTVEKKFLRQKIQSLET